MKNTPKDIYHVYELEANAFETGIRDEFWSNLVKTGGVFTFAIFVVFFIINFRPISNQLADWYQDSDQRLALELKLEPETLKTQKYIYSKDTDQDGLADELENVLGTDSVKEDSDGDGFGDAQELARGYNPIGEGLIKMEIKSSSGQNVIPVSFGDVEAKEGKATNYKINEEGNPMMAAYVIGSSINQEIETGENIIVNLNYGNKTIKGVYQVTKKRTGDLSDTDLASDGIKIMYGRPNGTDWQRVVLETKLIGIL